MMFYSVTLRIVSGKISSILDQSQALAVSLLLVFMLNYQKQQDILKTHSITLEVKDISTNQTINILSLHTDD